MGSVASTHKEKYRTPFAPVMPDVEFVRFNDTDDLKAKFSADVCAICIEPVQGEGGIHPVSMSSSLPLANSAILPARYYWRMRYRAVLGVRGNGLLISTTAYSLMSQRWRNR